MSSSVVAADLMPVSATDPTPSTFLFTDLVGSTRLWEEKPQEMGRALLRHDALVRAVVAEAGGRVFKTTGDGAAAIFEAAFHALQAAVALQESLQSEAWPEGVSLSARMALHTGSAEARDGDFYGQTLNRVARLMSAGHGGQILLSQAACDACRDHLPPEMSLVDLGRHRLKDLARSETIWQADSPILSPTFPPLRSLENPELRNNLPVQITSFIGRDKEIAAVRGLLTEPSHQNPLLTLMGPGGTGKTRLSLQAAADLLGTAAFPDGVWFVELASVADSTLLPAAVAQVLGVREESGTPLSATITDFLKPKRLLLLLDNCEHLTAATAVFVAGILRACPSVTLLATSREALGIVGEQTFPVPSLSLPELPSSAGGGYGNEANIPFHDSLHQYESVRLLMDRISATRPDFSITEENAPAVAAICRRLDGIPFALELAAARARSLSMDDINRRLDQRFRLLTNSDRTALPRQQTLRALIDWSYDLLNDEEKTVLHRLTVFAGGWTLPAAEQVSVGADSIDDTEVLDLLTSLVDKSLVLIDEQRDGSLRYRLLETVRAYAAEKLHDSGEEATVRRRHALWYLSLADEAKKHVSDATQASWYDRLETEHDNLRTALEWATAFPTEAANTEGGIGLRLAESLAWFWYIRGYLTEGRARLEVLLRAAAKQPDSSEEVNGKTADLLASASQMTGNLTWAQGDFPAAVAHFETARQWYRRLNNLPKIADCLNSMAILTKERGDYTQARAFYEEALTIFQQTGNRRGIGNILGNMGHVLRIQGDYVTARAYHEESLTIYQEQGDPRSIASSLGSLGAVAREEENWEEARDLFEQALALFREVNERPSTAMVLCFLSFILHRQGEEAQARICLEESLHIRAAISDRRGIPPCLEGFALLSPSARKAVVLYGAAAHLREQIGMPMTPEERKYTDPIFTEAQTTLGEKAFQAAWKEGYTLSQSEAIQAALNTFSEGLPTA